MNREIALPGLGITVLWVLAMALTGSTEALLFLAPALLIAIPLLSGFYIGEELIEKLAAARHRRSRRRAAPVLRIPPAPLTWSPRGARLVAFGLAKRPPPARLIPQN